MAGMVSTAGKMLTFTFALAVVLTLLFLFGQRKAREPLPALAAELAQARSLCEQHAAAVKGLQAEGQIDGPALVEGKDLYIAAKAEYDGCVTFLLTALDAGFAAGHADDGKALLQRARTRGDAFVAWARRVEQGHGHEKGWPGGGAGPVDLLGLVRWAKASDTEEVQALKAELEKCRFKPWAEVAADPPR